MFYLKLKPLVCKTLGNKKENFSFQIYLPRYHWITLKGSHLQIVLPRRNLNMSWLFHRQYLFHIYCKNMIIIAFYIKISIKTIHTKFQNLKSDLCKKDSMMNCWICFCGALIEALLYPNWYIPSTPHKMARHITKFNILLTGFKDAQWNFLFLFFFVISAIYVIFLIVMYFIIYC